MSREWPLRADDIIEACRAIQDYTDSMDFAAFLQDRRTRDAVIRNLEIIGEAAKHIPGDMRALAPDIQWRDICGMRDVLSHEYFGTNDAIVWNVVEVEIQRLLAAAQIIRNNAEDDE